MKNLPSEILVLLALPFFFFVGASLSVLFSLAVLSGQLQNRISVRPEAHRGFAPVYNLYSAPPPVLGDSVSRVETADARALTLEQFFSKYQSPLSQVANLFIEVADKYKIPWQLLPAISMQESLGGKNVPEDCFNPFGWGIHARGRLCFKNWPEGIEKVAQGFKEKYIDNGLVTMEEIMKKYNPISYNRDGSWGNGVQFFLNEIGSFNTP